MPTYTIENTEEDEIYDTVCSWNDLQTFLSENPQYKKVVTAPAIVGGISGKTHKTDAGFNETMSNHTQTLPWLNDMVMVKTLQKQELGMLQKNISYLM